MKSCVRNLMATRVVAVRKNASFKEMIAESFVTDSRGLGITVHDGIVTLTGRPETPQAGRDLVEVVLHIDGVIAVRDQLSHAGTPR